EQESSASGRISRRGCQLQGDFAGRRDVARSTVVVGQGETGFATQPRDSKGFGFGVEESAGGYRRSVKDRSMKQLNGGSIHPAGQSGANFISEHCKRCANRMRARRTKTVEHGESDLRVEDLLADGLEREQLAGLRLEFLDAGLAGGGDRLKDDG